MDDDTPAPAAPGQGDPAQAIALLAGELAGRIQAHFAARAAEVGLSVPEAKAVLAIEPEDEVTMRELASRMNANPSNVTVVVGKLTVRGFLAHATGAGDRRVRPVALTESGTLLRKRFQDCLANNNPLTAGLSAAECHAFRDLLTKVSEGHHSAP
ncbi:hypothetical protein ALI144C_13715 [Actinosynnema sp. ALI-1.44]|uniref:MarR family winged helix-turn-helix transcriptional regulator n=1 Tax=Actinosynnema sp. ALI-1.44 TaxID=1933779 RepID=UPI00097C169E|nr:MarR family winged helix-turn-helix transcriptional regulator [Actinosynnema sp. ALI-1.44]ONI85350.1 hypothetical protein ALI144C_13715 [Actinosynnema sp. ALI-1.44]